jgi:HEAT repeat protein
MATLPDFDAEIRTRAAEALGGMGENAKPALAEVRKGLNDPHGLMCIASAEAVWRIAKDSATVMPVIRPFLKHQEKDYRVRAINLLGELETAAKPMQADIIALLKDREAEVRAAAAGALGRQGKEAMPAAEALFKRLEDDDGWVRVASAQALSRIGSHKDIAMLVLAVILRDKEADKEVRIGAASALGEIGPDAKKAVPDLMAALKDAPEPLRDAVTEALKKIDPAAGK